MVMRVKFARPFRWPDVAGPAILIAAQWRLRTLVIAQSVFTAADAAGGEESLRAAIVAGHWAIAAVAVHAAPRLALPAAVGVTLALAHPFILAPAPFRVLVAEPRGDLVAGALEKAALVAAVPLTAPVAIGIAAGITVLRPARTFITRCVPRVVAVISHV